MQPCLDMRQAMKLKLETHHDEPNLVAPRVLKYFLPDACTKSIATAHRENWKQFHGTTKVRAELLFSGSNTIA